MKKLLFLLLLSLICSSYSYSQSYIPVIQEGSFWDVISTGPGTCAYFNRYRIGNDFTHNGKVYKNIEWAPVRGEGNPNSLCHPSGDMYVNESEFVEMTSFIREDIDEKKVYILILGDDNEYHEYTMADFNLEVGDVMTNAYSFGTDNSVGADLTIIQISTSSDGRKRYYIENGNEWFEEGIGSNQGPVQIYRPYILYEDQNNMACFGNNATNNSSCAPVLSINDYQLSQINIFPNPTSDKILLTNLEGNTFKIYSIIGKEMSFQFSPEENEIDISHLNQGIYFLEIRGSQNSKRLVKIIKS